MPLCAVSCHKWKPLKINARDRWKNRLHNSAINHSRNHPASFDVPYTNSSLNGNVLFVYVSTREYLRCVYIHTTHICTYKAIICIYVAWKCSPSENPPILHICQMIITVAHKKHTHAWLNEILNHQFYFVYFICMHIHFDGLEKSHNFMIARAFKILCWL